MFNHRDEKLWPTFTLKELANVVKFNREGNFL